MTKFFGKKDWFAGLVSLIVLFAANSAFLPSLEPKTYDFCVQASARDAADKVGIIAIDHQRIANIGRWLWFPDDHAKMIAKLSAGQVNVIDPTVHFLEPQISPNLSNINKNSTFVASLTISTIVPEASQLDAMLKEALLAELKRGAELASYDEIA